MKKHTHHMGLWTPGDGVFWRGCEFLPCPRVDSMSFETVAGILNQHLKWRYRKVGNLETLIDDDRTALKLVDTDLYIREKRK